MSDLTTVRSCCFVKYLGLGMDLSLVASNFFNPPILFFFLGMLAVLSKSDLEIPQPIPKFFSLYLLIAIGFRGGVELVNSGFSQEVVLAIGAAIFMSCAVPIYTYFILRTKLDAYNSAAIAATYGAISAVTFITASTLLEQIGIKYDGYMVAALALMESPAIIVGLVLVQVFGAERGEGEKIEWGEVLKESFLNGSVFLLFGSIAIGMLSGEHGYEKVKPFIGDMFYGALMFFLLDMGLIAAKRIKDLQKTGIFLIAFAILIPILNAGIGTFIAYFIHMSKGDALLFAVLCASASYIAVPAAMRMTVPEANPSLYISTALAVTFPFNIVFGIPLYLYGISLIWG